MQTRKLRMLISGSLLICVALPLLFGQAEPANDVLDRGQRDSHAYNYIVSVWYYDGWYENNWVYYNPNDPVSYDMIVVQAQGPVGAPQGWALADRAQQRFVERGWQWCSARMYDSWETDFGMSSPEAWYISPI